MAKVFLDTNIFIDAIHRKPEEQILASLLGDSVFISPLSIHIYCYLFHIQLPDARVAAQVEKFGLVELSESLASRALEGPTSDFEDNVQLLSSTAAECDVFVTADKKLLALKFFGQTRIVSTM